MCVYSQVLHTSFSAEKGGHFDLAESSEMINTQHGNANKLKRNQANAMTSMIQQDLLSIFQLSFVANEQGFSKQFSQQII